MKRTKKPNRATKKAEKPGHGFFPPAGLFLIAVGLLAATWQRWPNILVDYGRELYVPWQLAQGKSLYRDVEHLFGPLAQLFNSFLFRVFPVSMTTLFYSNFLLVIALVFVLYFFIQELTDRVTGFVAALFFLVLSAFGHFISSGNYNFITPYSHEATFGAAFVILLCFMLIRNLQLGQNRYLRLAGLFYGGAFLTKPEAFLSANTLLVLWVALKWVCGSIPLRNLGRSLGLILISAILFNAFVFLWFASSSSWKEAAQALLGAWRPLLYFTPASNLFYRHWSGLDEPALNLFLLFAFAGALVVYAGLTVFLDRLCTGFRRHQPALSLLALLVIIAPLCFFVFSVNRYWSNLSRGLPIINLLTCGWFFWMVCKTKRDHKEQTLYGGLCLLSGLAIGFSSRAALRMVPWHYGFILALPSFILLVVLLAWYMPRIARTFGGTGNFCRNINLGFLAVFLMFSWKEGNHFYSKKTFEIGKGIDSILTYPNAISRVVSSALDYIDTQIPKKATFIVVPEGVMLNFLSRHTNPTPFINFMPPELLSFGEERILNSFITTPPDYFIFVHKDSEEYGVRLFGMESNNGKQIMDWILANYEPIHKIGMEPLVREGQFGIKFLKRRGGSIN